MLIHGFKHYSGSGTGIRFLADISVFLREKGNSLNWDYVKKELDMLQIAEFEDQTRELAEKLFGKEESTSLAEEEQTILVYLMGAGTHGTVENWVTRAMEEIQQDGNITAWTRIRYVWRRLFPDKDFMKLYSAFCRKHPWSYPLVCIYRLVRALLVRRKAIRREIQALQNQSHP